MLVVTDAAHVEDLWGVTCGCNQSAHTALLLECGLVSVFSGGERLVDWGCVHLKLLGERDVDTIDSQSLIVPHLAGLEVALRGFSRTHSELVAVSGPEPVGFLLAFMWERN